MPPNRFRPPATLGDGVFESASNIILGRVLAYDIELRKRLAEGQAADAAPTNADGTPAAAVAGDAARRTERVIRQWDELCRAVACIPDATKSGNRSGKDPPGVKQLLERKQGLFRMNMMGKRVNFTCRSVISPDPNIGSNEIGIPDRFAEGLTFPEPITPWNVATLRQAVINGPAIHPGATMVQDSAGHMIDLSRQTHQQRVAIAKRLLVSVDTEKDLAMKLKEGGSAAEHAAVTPGDHKSASAETPGAAPSSDGGKLSGAKPKAATVNTSMGGSAKRVWRHLRDGDALLLNRQPTLHKPGIMAHKARVLKGEKVIRMPWPPNPAMAPHPSHGAPADPPSMMTWHR